MIKKAIDTKRRAASISVDYKILFENLPGLFLILLPDLSIAAVSDAYLKATLTKREEILGKNIFVVFPDNPEETDSTGELNLSASLKYVLKTKKEHIMALQRYDVRQPDGKFIKKYWRPINRPILSSSNEVVYIIHTVEDVTEVVSSDEERKKQEEQNHKIIKDLSDLKYAIDKSSIVSITDQKGIIMYANESFANISGYDREELVGSSHFLIKSGYHPKGYFKQMWQTISLGKVWKGEIKNRAKGGKEYWVNTTIVPFLNEFGKPYQYFSISSEITEQTHAEGLLKKSKEKFASLFDHNPAAIVVSRLSDAKIINVNNGFLSIGGYSDKSEVLGKTALELKILGKPEDREMVVQAIKENKMIKDYELKVFDKSGKPFWVSTSILVVEIEDVPCFLSISIDISNRKKVEEQLLSVNKELESFSYSVSHDLRAPLRAINGYTNILLEDYSSKLDQEGNRLLKVIIDNASMMGQLIDELLTFSRLGKQNLMKVKLDMVPIVENIIKELDILYPNSNREIKIKLSHNILGDHAMIRIIMTNLLSNAFKYSNKSVKPIIEIGSIVEKEKTIFYVKDNGAGFDMKYYNKLFGVFQRLHSTSEFEGTGVGLAIVNRIISKHDGIIWAESKLNEGSTFYFSLPNS